MIDSKEFLTRLKSQEQIYEQKKVTKIKAEQDLENNKKLLEEQIAEVEKLGVAESNLESELKKMEDELNKEIGILEESLK